ncbi:MAG: asparaginase [Lachnospiraceae bacterium]|nr:asparaginase [Lachnospiraceae bacterium]
MAGSDEKERICVLLTGGTICSAPDSAGKKVSNADKAGLKLTEQYGDGSLLPFADDVAFDLVNLETDILSENMTTDVWYEILDKFRTEILPKNYKGVIVLHGTDTLAYTSSFLSMALTGINIPVCMVSAQLSLDDERTNGYANFKAAVELIMNGIAPNVYAVYRNEANESNGLHEPGKLLVHYGSHLLQCPNGSNNFHSRDEMKVPDVNEANLPGCEGFKEGSGIFNETFSNKSEVCLIRPFTGLDYSEINLEGKKLVIHGTYHSESVCIGRNIYGKVKEADGIVEKKYYTLDEIIEKDRRYSILFLLKKCSEMGIPVFLAPCDRDAAGYSTTYNAIDKGAIPMKGITLEAAYAKAVLASFLGKQGKKLIDFMLADINGEKPHEEWPPKAES